MICNDWDCEILCIIRRGFLIFSDQRRSDWTPVSTCFIRYFLVGLAFFPIVGRLKSVHRKETGYSNPFRNEAIPAFILFQLFQYRRAA